MPYSQAGDLEAEVVFVGSGKSDEDYLGKDVNVRAYPGLQAKIEAANLLEVRELCEEGEAGSTIQALADDLSVQHKRELERIQNAYGLLLKQYGIKESGASLRAAYKEASDLTPKRLFKGPLPGGYLQEKIGDEAYRWYGENSEKIGGNEGSKMYEIINLMDGARTLLDIRHIVSIEFGETDVDFVLRYARDLKSAGLIDF